MKPLGPGSTLLAAACVLVSHGCAHHPCPTATPRPWSQVYETKSLDAVEAAVREPIGERMAAVMQCETDPCSDFYQYACGGWLEAFEAGQAYRGVGHREIWTLDELWIRDIIKVAERTPEQSEDRRRIAEFSLACKDETPREGGAALLRNVLALLDGIDDLDDFGRVLGELQYFGGAPALLTVGGHPHEGREVLWLTLPITGMDAFRYADGPLVRRYRGLIHDSFVALGMPRSRARAEAEFVVEMETALAELELRSAPRQSAGEVEWVTPRAFSWPKVLSAMGLDETTPIFSDRPALVRDVFASWTKPESLPRLVAYMRWQVVRVNAVFLGGTLEALHDDFFIRELFGMEAYAIHRERRCTEATYAWLGDTLDRYFAKVAYSDEQHQLATDIARRVAKGFEARLEASTWLDTTTRRALGVKLQSMEARIGRPKSWRSFPSDVALGSDHAVNVFRLRRARAIEDYRGLDETLPPRWGPLAVANAWYDVGHNRVTVPAGLLQPPYFGSHQPYVMNMARIGSVIGHEVSHAFDDYGRHFDASGRVAMQFTATAEQAFGERAQCLVDAYDGLAVARTQIDGRRTLGENIADLGGMHAAWTAYTRWLGEHPDRAGPHVDGLTDAQLFFIAHAQTWCSTETDEEAAWAAEVDAHSPSHHRVNVVLANFPPFREAFACTPGEPMAAQNACEVW